VVVVLAAATISAGVRATRSESPARSKATPGTQPVPAPGSTQATTTTRPLPPEPAYVTTIKAQVSELRGLAWKAPLAVDVVSKTELARRYRAGVERDIKPDRLAGDGDAFTVLHLIPAGTDYAKTVEDLFAGLVLGFYDPETKELVVGDSGGELDPGTKVTLAHELDHALTDQWFDFGSRTKALDDADRQEELDAFDALIEGDAKLLEERFADKYLTEDEQLVYALGGLGGGGDDAAATAVARAPKFILDYLYFPYTQGLEFVRAQVAARRPSTTPTAARPPRPSRSCIPTSTPPRRDGRPPTYPTWPPPPAARSSAATRSASSRWTRSWPASWADRRPRRRPPAGTVTSSWRSGVAPPVAW
jgi:hypothetical protein